MRDDLKESLLLDAKSAAHSDDDSAVLAPIALSVASGAPDAKNLSSPATPIAWPHTRSVEVNDFLRAMNWEAIELQRAGISYETLHALLTKSYTSRALRWLALEDLMIKITGFFLLNRREIWATPSVVHDGDFAAFAAWCRAYVWPSGKNLPFKKESALKIVYGIHQFYDGAEMVITQVWTLLLASFLGNDLYYYFNPGPYVRPTLQDTFLAQSGNERALVTSLSRPDHRFGAAVFFAAPLIWGLVKAIYSRSQHTEALTDTDLSNMKDALKNYQPGLCQDVFAWVLPMHPLGNLLSRVRRALLWDNRLTKTQRSDLFKAFLEFTGRTHKVTQWNSLEILAEITDGIAMPDFIELRSLLTKLTEDENDLLRTFLVTKVDSFAELQRLAEHYQLPSPQNEQNIYARYLKPLIRYLIAHYLLWCSGQPKAKKAQLFFYLFKAIKLAIKINFALLVLNGIQAAVQFDKEEEQCKSQSKKWLYMTQSGQFECTVCGDLPIFYKDVFDISSCINAYLSVPRTPNQIADVLSRVQPGDDIQTLDLTNQLFPDEENGLAVVIPAIKTYIPNLVHLILYAGQNGEFLNPTIGPKGAQIIANHLPTWSLSAISLAGQSKLANGTIAFAQAFRYSQLNGVDLRNCGIDDISGVVLMEETAASNITALYIGGNQLGDPTAFALARVLPTSHLLIVEIPNNNIGPLGGAAVAQVLPYSSLTALDISNNPLKSARNDLLAASRYSQLKTLMIGGETDGLVLNGTSLELALENPHLTTLSLAALPIGGNAGPNGRANFAVIVRHFQSGHSNLISLDLSYSFVNASDCALFAPAIPFSSLKTLNLMSNPIGDEGGGYIAVIFPYSNLTTIYFERTGIGAGTVFVVAQTLPRSKLQYVGLGANPNIADAIAVLGDAIAEYKTSSIILDLNNINMGPKGAQGVAQGTARSKIKSIDLYMAGNPRFGSNGTRAFVETLPNGNIRVLAISGNGYSQEDIAFLFRNIPGSGVEVIEVSDANLAGIGTAIAENLVTKPQIAHPLWLNAFDPSITRVVAQPQPTSPVSDIWMQHDALNTSDAVALCRAIPYTDVAVTNLYLQDNPNIDPNQVNISTCATSAASSLRPSSTMTYGPLILLAAYFFYQLYKIMTQDFSSPNDAFGNAAPTTHQTSASFFKVKSPLTYISQRAFKKAIKELMRAMLNVDRVLRELDNQSLSEEACVDVERIRFYWLEHADMVEELKNTGRATRKQVATLHEAIEEMHMEASSLLASITVSPATANRNKI